MQGNIISIIDENGLELVKYEYEAFGNIIETIVAYGYQNIADMNVHTYRGYRYDSEINMYYLNSRYYRPETGRFINSDGSLGQFSDMQSSNLYAFCANNPIFYVDSSGASYEVGSGGGGSGRYFISANDVLDFCFDYCYYKGVLVKKHNLPGNPGWAINGIIHLDVKERYPLAVNHEYGHIIQEQKIGKTLYFFRIAIPSFIGFALGVDKYYLQPWELSAEYYGGVTNRPKFSYSMEDTNRALNYLDYGVPYSNREIVQFFTKIKRFFDDLLR